MSILIFFRFLVHIYTYRQKTTAAFSNVNLEQNPSNQLKLPGTDIDYTTGWMTKTICRYYSESKKKIYYGAVAQRGAAVQQAVGMRVRVPSVPLLSHSSNGKDRGFLILKYRFNSCMRHMHKDIHHNVYAAHWIFDSFTADSTPVIFILQVPVG